MTHGEDLIAQSISGPVIENGRVTVEACEKFLDTRDIVTDEHAFA